MCPPAIAGGLPQVSITNFTTFGRQSTNPQWQDPALLDPKGNFTWIRGKHSLKFGYEYEHIWMAVNDNNPALRFLDLRRWLQHLPVGTTVTGPACTGTKVADDYWADFLFGLTSSYQLANYFVVHLRQSLDSAYAQDDWKVTPKLTLNLGLRWEYGSPYSEWKNYISNFDPVNQVVDTISPGAVAGNGIMPVTGSGVYGKTLVNPDLHDFMPRVGFAFCRHARIRSSAAASAPATFTTRVPARAISRASTLRRPNSPRLPRSLPALPIICSTPLPAQIIAVGSTTPSCYATADQGFPSGLVTTFNPATDNITWVPKNTPDSYVENYLPQRAASVDEEHSRRRRLRRQPRTPSAGLCQCEPESSLDTRYQQRPEILPELAQRHH